VSYWAEEKFQNADICRRFGDFLEVECYEGMYQDITKHLPYPDVVVMFSPGLGQINRRAWDGVVTELLHNEVPLLVCDQATATIPEDKAEVDDSASQSWVDAPPGGAWSVELDRNLTDEGTHDDRNTLITMNAYSAVNYGAVRNPFPICQNNSGSIIAKNGVIQVFRGFRDGAPRPAQPPRLSEQEEEILQEQLEEAIHELGLEEESIEEYIESLSIPVSAAYDKASVAILQDYLMARIENEKLLEVEDTGDEEEQTPEEERDAMKRLMETKYEPGHRGTIMFLQDLAESALQEAVSFML